MTTTRCPLALLAAALAMPAVAGPAAPPAPAAASSGDWCSWLQSKPGTLYKNPENPYLQLLQIGGRAQYQAAYIDGHDAAGTDFHDTYSDWRRVRLESRAEFLRFLALKVNLNMAADSRPSGGDLDWGYQDFDEALLTFDMKKAFDIGALDTFRVNYGRHKFVITDEVRMSSRDIYTIERSAIANKVYNGARPTGVTIDLAKGPWSATLGLFSSEADSEFISGWGEGETYYAALGYKVSDELRLSAEYVKNNPSATDDRLGYDWATAINATWTRGRAGAIGTFVVGENNSSVANRGGSFHGLAVTPWYWIVEEKLQAVFQYQYSGASQEQGIRTNSRYVRADHDTVAISGRGDKLHTLYAGLNYHLCGHNAKIMGGIEYTTLGAPAGTVDAMTYLIAFRAAF